MKTRHLINHLIISSLLIASLLPFFTLFSGILSSKTLASLGEKILICTIDGYQWINKEDIRNGTAPLPSTTHNRCPLCILANLNIAPTPSALAQPFRYALAHPITYYSHDQHYVFSSYTSYYTSRAPPAPHHS